MYVGGWVVGWVDVNRISERVVAAWAMVVVVMVVVMGSGNDRRTC